MLDGSLSAKATKSACCALWRKVRVSLPADTDPARIPRANLETLRCTISP